MLLVTEHQDEHVHGSFSNVSVVQKAPSLKVRDGSGLCFYHLLLLFSGTRLVMKTANLWLWSVAVVI